MTKPRRLVLVVPVLALTAGMARPLRARTLEHLVSAAHLIVAGTSNLNSQFQSGRSIGFTIQIERVFKGELPPGARIQAEYEPSQSIGPGPLGRVSLELRGLWFLTRSRSTWKCLPARAGHTLFINSTFYPISPQPLPEGLRHDEFTAVADKLILEIAAAAEHENPRRDIPGAVVEAAQSADSPAIRKAFGYMAKSSNLRVRALGLAGLIERGDTLALAQLEREVRIFADRLRQDEAAAERGARLAWEMARVTGNVGCFFRNPDPAALAILARLALADLALPQLAGAAAAALSAMHTRESLPFLVQLLDSQRPEIRGSGISGLASFANGFPMRTPQNEASLGYMQRQEHAPYRTNETMEHFGSGGPVEQGRHIAFWKNWWVIHQAELTAPPRPPSPPSTPPSPPPIPRVAPPPPGGGQPSPTSVPPGHPEVFFGFFGMQEALSREIETRKATNSAAGQSLEAGALALFGVSAADFAAITAVSRSVNAQLQALSAELLAYSDPRLAAKQALDLKVLKEFDQRRTRMLQDGATALQNRLTPAGWSALQRYLANEYARGLRRLPTSNPN